MKTDNSKLTGIIERCFDYSMDARLSPAQQSDFLAIGKRLRGSLLNLLSATFNDGTQAVVDANKALTQENQDLGNSKQVITNITGTLKNLTQLVGVLDGLLKIAAGFK